MYSPGLNINEGIYSLDLVECQLNLPDPLQTVHTCPSNLPERERERRETQRERETERKREREREREREKEEVREKDLEKR